MKVKQIKKIADKISKKYGMVDKEGNALVWVEKLDKNRVEVRTEMPSYEGGFEFQEAINKLDKNYVAENQGGCIYIVYKSE